MPGKLTRGLHEISHERDESIAPVLPSARIRGTADIARAHAGPGRAGSQPGPPRAPGTPGRCRAWGP